MNVWARSLVAAAVVAPSVLAVAEPVQADLSPTIFSADPLPTWQTDGAVWALETVGDVVYVGGVFNAVRPPGTAAGSSQSVTRRSFAAFHAVTGELLPCAPSFTSSSTTRVLALEASPDGSRLYVGGTFSGVSGTSVANLVALDVSSCSLVPSASFRRPNVGGTVRAVSATATGVYAGGDFNSVDGQSRPKLAGFTAGGALTSMTANPDGTVRAILAAPEHGKVYVGGNFQTVNSVASRGLIALDPATGAIVRGFNGWFPTSSAVKALAADGDGRFFVGAEGSGFGVFDGRLAADIASGSMLWRDSCLGATQAVVAYQGVLYGGHHAHECMLTPGGFREDGFRTHLTAQDVETKTLFPNFWPNTNDGIGTAPQGPRALVVSNDRLWVGGEFTTVEGAAQQGLTRFGITDIGTVAAPTLTVDRQRAGVNVVHWTARFDSDDHELTYDLYRNGQLIDSQTRRSRWWIRPRMSFVDTGVVAGQQVTYRMRVREPDGGNVGPLGASVTVTTASVGDPYPTAVLGDGPSLYWRLDETVEQAVTDRSDNPYLRALVVDSSGNDYSGTAERGFVTTQTGYTLGGASALESGTGRSITFDGTNGRVAGSFTNDDRPARTAPDAYSVEFWFRSTTTSGGRLVGFGDNRTGEHIRTQPADPLANVAPPVLTPYTSTLTDRHVYLSNSGKLVFGKLVGTTKVTVKTPESFNDGQWHQVVATSGPSGMRLYVDSSLRASSSNTGSRSYAGYWRVGTDSLTGWSDKPSKNGITGSVDEVSVFDRELTSGDVVQHYAAARPSLQIDTEPPSAVTGVSAAVSAGTVNVSYDAAADNVGVVQYELFRTASAATPPTSADRVATSTGTTASEAGVPAGEWVYWVAAKDAAGNLGETGSAPPVTVEQQPVTETQTVTAQADSYVHATNTGTNYGTSTTTMVDSDPYQATYLRFGLPAAPGGGTLTSAVLRIRTSVNSFAGSPDAVGVELADNAWSETSVTYGSRPEIGGPLLGSLPGGSQVDTTYDVPLAVGPLRALLGSATTLALTPQGPDSVQFRTREATGQKPQLLLGFTSGPPDTAPPSQVGGVSAQAAGSNVTVSWQAATDDVGVDGYDVHRLADAADPPTDANRVGRTSGLSLVEAAVPAGTWTYRVAARDAAGNRGPFSDGALVTVESAPVQQTVTLAPTADTYVHQSFKTTNYGTATMLSTDSEPLQAVYQRFALPTQPGATLTSAVLRVRSTGSSFATSADGEEVRLTSDGWVESAMTFNDRPTPGAVLGVLAAPTGLNTWYEIPLDTAAVAAVLGQNLNLALTSVGSDSFQLHAREGGAALAPQLVLTFVS